MSTDNNTSGAVLGVLKKAVRDRIDGMVCAGQSDGESLDVVYSVFETYSRVPELAVYAVEYALRRIKESAGERSYELTSTHTQGYSWQVTAPALLEGNDLARLLEALAGWDSGAATQNDLEDMLQGDAAYLANYFDDFNTEAFAQKLALFRMVAVRVRQVHSAVKLDKLEEV